METDVVVVYAENDPMPGVANPGPHQIYRNPRVTIETRNLGDLNPDEIRVEMIYAGVCGTDAHLVSFHPDTGYIRSSAPLHIPSHGRIIGHEGVGRVLAVGANVRHIKPGAYVTFESIVVCHFCDVCRRGQFNQCRCAKLLGLELDGIFGTVVDVHAMLAHDVTALIKNEEDLKAMACVEPAGVAYVACKNAGIKGGDVVVIFGAGPIGFFASVLARTAFGASEVHVVEPSKFRRTFAEQWSAGHVYDVESFFDSGPSGIDVVVEASGCVDNIVNVFQRVGANGRIVLLARSGAPLKLDALDHMITNEISMIGSRGHLCGAFSDIFRLYKTKWLPLDEVVTEVVDGVPGLIEILQTPGQIFNENCKVLVRF